MKKRHVGVDSKNKGSWGQTPGPARRAGRQAGRRAGQSGAVSRRTVSRGQRPRQPSPPPAHALCFAGSVSPLLHRHTTTSGQALLPLALVFAGAFSLLLHTESETKCHAIPVPLSFSSSFFLSFFLSPSQTCGVPPSFSHSPTALRPLHS